jgi:hypothetical protein
LRFRANVRPAFLRGGGRFASKTRQIKKYRCPAQ